MHLLLIGLFTWISAGIVQRALLGAGLAFGTYLILVPAVDFCIDQLTSILNGNTGSNVIAGGITAANIISAILSCGVDTFITIIVSAYITRFAFLQIQTFVVRTST